MQKHIDSSISKTINVPADIPFERFKDVYLQAYALGLQGLHDLSPQRGDRRGAGGRAEAADAAGTRRARQPELPLPPPPPAPHRSRPTSSRPAASST